MNKNIYTNFIKKYAKKYKINNYTSKNKKYIEKAKKKTICKPIIFLEK